MTNEELATIRDDVARGDRSTATYVDHCYRLLELVDSYAATLRTIGRIARIVEKNLGEFLDTSNPRV